MSVRHGMGRAARLSIFVVLAFALACGGGPSDGRTEEESSLRQTAFRVRSDFDVPLNADSGWAAGENEPARIPVDRPFRVRFEVENPDSTRVPPTFRLQYRRGGGAWKYALPSDFPYPAEITPPVGIVSTAAYDSAAATADLLSGSSRGYHAGVGMNLQDTTPAWEGFGDHGEWEWPLVVRRYADGPVTSEEGDTFSFRMVRADGTPLTVETRARVTVTVPERHLGGTFVETPGRLGPWQASSGELYFIMEPTEIHNVLMMVRSRDGGESWAEVDGANRPDTGDLEGFATAHSGERVHMLHQIDEKVVYHRFRTADHEAEPDTWEVRDEVVARPGEPPTQVATIAVRPDGSVVAIYGSPEKLRYKIRSPGGSWDRETVIDPDVPHSLSGPQAVLGEKDAVHLAYTASDGTAWYRRIRPDGTLSPRQQLAKGVGSSEEDRGAILPLVSLPELGRTAVIYRLNTGQLWARRVSDEGRLTRATRVTGRRVVQSAVDSDQVGADAIAADDEVHVLFIDERSGAIYHTRSRGPGSWSDASLEVDGVEAQWVRGNLIRTEDGGRAYGFVYDAGSYGGTGMNRYSEVPIGAE